MLLYFISTDKYFTQCRMDFVRCRLNVYLPSYHHISSYLLLINTFKTYTFSLTREQDAQGTYCALTVALNN